jgi:hypothetical protein
MKNASIKPAVETSIWRLIFIDQRCKFWTLIYEIKFRFLWRLAAHQKLDESP